LKYLKSACLKLGQYLPKNCLVVVKSTVPPGTNRLVVGWIKKYAKVKFETASIPEFLSEGQAIENTLHPHRIVLGVESVSTAKVLLKLHAPLNGKRLVCDPITAQLVKYGANTFLPLKISFANEMAVICDHFGVDIKQVMQGIGLDKRIGTDFFGSGIGFGGSCFPKDIRGLSLIAGQAGYNFRTIKAAYLVNQHMIDYAVKKIKNLFNQRLTNKILVILGVSFKPETSDIREARSLLLIKRLLQEGCQIRVCDPVALAQIKPIFPQIKDYPDPYLAAVKADGLILVTEWQDYRKLDFKKIKNLMKQPGVFDGRNIYNKKQLLSLGYKYQGVGR
jgi:UDPglucose 6-dehydrogenase